MGTLKPQSIQLLLKMKGKFSISVFMLFKPFATAAGLCNGATVVMRRFRVCVDSGGKNFADCLRIVA
jgi:hypothetical protein